MTAADFRRIALSLEGVEEYSHAGLPAFRVGGRKFASLASQAEGYGKLMLTRWSSRAVAEARALIKAQRRRQRIAMRHPPAGSMRSAKTYQHASSFDTDRAMLDR